MNKENKIKLRNWKEIETELEKLEKSWCLRIVELSTAYDRLDLNKENNEKVKKLYKKNKKINYKKNRQLFHLLLGEFPNI